MLPILPPMFDLSARAYKVPVLSGLRKYYFKPWIETENTRFDAVHLLSKNYNFN